MVKLYFFAIMVCIWANPNPGGKATVSQDN